MKKSILLFSCFVLPILLTGCEGPPPMPIPTFDSSLLATETATPTSPPPPTLTPTAEPTLFPTPSVAHFLIADFQTCFDMGSASPAGDLNNFLRDQCVPGAGRGNTIAQLDYEVPSAWAAFWIRLNGADFTAYDTLAFYARADADVGIPPQLKLELKREDGAEISIYNLSGLRAEWDYYEVRLENFRTPPGMSPLCSWEDMGELAFTFESGVSGTTGRIYLDNIYLEHRQNGAPTISASCPSPTPTPDPDTVQPPTLPTALVVSDFDRCGTPNNLGGSMGTSYNAPDSLIERYIQENGRGCVVRLEYSVQEWSAFWQKLQGQDLTHYGQLTFDLKGNATVGILREVKIELKRPGEMAFFYIEDITDSWQTYTVDLVDFLPTLSSWTGIEELVFTFEANGSGARGVVYLDNVQFQP